LLVSRELLDRARLDWLCRAETTTS
jgi:hypothetical protein